MCTLADLRHLHRHVVGFPVTHAELAYLAVLAPGSPPAAAGGFHDADIRFAISTARYDAKIDEDEFDNKHLIIGFDRNVNLLEIMYNVIDEDTINVFHAMKCRKTFLPLIKARGENNG
jgi:hypothetical protein